MFGFFHSIIIQCIAIAVLFFLLVYSILQKPSEMQKHVAILTISAILFLLGYLFRLKSDTIQGAMLGATITYIGQPFVLLSAMMLLSTFFGYTLSGWKYTVLCIIAALVPLAVSTNEIHHLFYATATFDSSAQYSPLITTHGPLYNVNLIIALAYFVSYIIIILRGYRKTDSKIKRSMSVYSVLMVLSGMLGYLLYFLNLTGGYDTTMIGIALGTVFLSIMFFRCRIFDFVDKAKEFALDISTEGLVVFDDVNNIVYKNKVAVQLMENDVSKNYIESLSDGKTIYSKNSNHFELNIQTITHRNEYLGKSIEIHDISESLNHQKNLENAVQKTKDRLETIQRKIFASMASIVEARSVETGDHIKRVSDYTSMIAESLRSMGRYEEELTDEYISTLVLSSPLHDIGKISIPDAILQKPGPLSTEEFEVIKTHSEKGAEIIRKTMNGLESDEYIEMATNIARYHHEWWDGHGYPNGLQKEEIPLCARIVALADCYDALTSKRCYKEAFPNEKALNIIQNESGTHFDPFVVAAFLRCYNVVQV